MIHSFCFKPTVVAIAAALATPLALAGDLPSREAMWQLIQQQQRQLDKLRQRIEHTDAKAEAAIEAVETAQFEPSGSAGWANRTRVGGYGEIHYNNLLGEGGASDYDRAHRLLDSISGSSALAQYYLWHLLSVPV